MWSEFVPPSLDQWVELVAKEAGKTPEELATRSWEGLSYPACCEPRPAAQSSLRHAGRPRLIQALPRDAELWRQARAAEVSEIVDVLQPEDHLEELPAADVLRGPVSAPAMIAVANRLSSVKAVEVDLQQLLLYQDANVLLEAASESNRAVEFRLTTHSWTSAGCDAVQELSWAFAGLIEAWRTLPESCASRVGLQLKVSPRLLLETARLRAAHQMWQQVCRGFQLSEAPRLHVIQDERWFTRRDVHNNLLRSTLTGVASLWGGATSVELLRLDDTPDSCRWARNVMHLLCYESGLDRFVDPLVGSGLIEHLTEQIADEAWRELQRIEKRGGLAAQTDLLARAADRREALLSKLVLVGVNRYRAESPLPDRPPALLYGTATPCSCQQAGEYLEAGHALSRTGLLPRVPDLHWETELS